jgi:hypothetical protein
MYVDIFTLIHISGHGDNISAYLYMDVSDDKIKVRKDSEFLYNIIGVIRVYLRNSIIDKIL